MTITVAWQQATKYPAAIDRDLIAAVMAHETDTTALDGVLTMNGLAASFDTGMKVTVAAGQAMVGGYVVTLDPGASVTLDVGGAQKRTDLIVLRVYDEQEGDSASEGVLEVVKGDPGGTVPDVPARSLLLAKVSIAATQSTLTVADIVDERQYTTANGGVVLLPNEQFDASANIASYPMGLSLMTVQSASWPTSNFANVLSVSHGATGYQFWGRSHSGSSSMDLRYRQMDQSGPGPWVRLYPHTADDLSGVLPVSKGGTGRSSLTSGQYLQGAGAGAVVSRSAAQVWSDITAQASTADLKGTFEKPRQVTDWNDDSSGGPRGLGIFFSYAGAANAPGTGGWFGFTTGYPDQTYVEQVVFSASAINAEMWIRTKHVGDPWPAWKQIYGDTGWLNCSMASGISGQVKARVLNGVVWLSGAVSGALSGNGTKIATLAGSIPRPPNIMSSAVQITSVSYSTVRIDTNGDIEAYSSSSSINVDGVSYPAS